MRRMVSTAQVVHNACAERSYTKHAQNGHTQRMRRTVIHNACAERSYTMHAQNGHTQRMRRTVKTAHVEHNARAEQSEQHK